jgi:hypothetical protein
MENSEEIEDVVDVDGAIKLYPDKLVQLHKDLDDFAYGRATADIFNRLPPSLCAAEILADKALSCHLKEVLGKISEEQYFKMVLNEASDISKKLYLLRCYIAGCSAVTEFDKIEFMTTGSLFESNALTYRDILPVEVVPIMKQALDNFGIEISRENAWSLLSDLDREASIKDRIVGRLLYLIENANTVERNSMLFEEVGGNFLPCNKMEKKDDQDSL